MAPASLPKPGSKYGPCTDACKHTDCTQTRATAETLCPDCSQPIGYDHLFYQLDRGGYGHAYCTEKRLSL